MGQVLLHLLLLCAVPPAAVRDAGLAYTRALLRSANGSVGAQSGIEKPCMTENYLQL